MPQHLQLALLVAAGDAAGPAAVAAHVPQEKNDDRVAAQDLHELGFMTGIFDGHRGGQS